MRTKTLILSAVVGALSSVSLMAQVYSLNAVGYINVSCPGPGFSIIANQLNTTDNNISPLLDSQLLDGQHNGVELFKYSTAGGYNAFVVSSGAAWSSTAVTNTTLNPGEAAFIYNPFSTNITLTFVGTVLTGSLTNTLNAGFNLVSSMVPQTGALDTALGVVPGHGDIVFTFSTTGGYSADLYNSSGNWSANGLAPVPAVGQGFFYYSAAGANWVQNFSVN
jgi:hypothetical protein